MERRETEQERGEQMQPGRQFIADNEDAVEEDGTPVLDEQDLEENGISEEEADNIEWEEPQ